MKHPCRSWLSLSLLSIFLFSCAIAQKGDEGAVKEFQDRIDNYLSAKKKTDVARKPTDSPDKLAQQKQQTAEKSQQARPEAQRGDIFTPTVSAYFKNRLRTLCMGRRAAESVRACAMPSRYRTYS